MPNWCEGVMKLRGSKDDILSFLEDGIEGCFNDSSVKIDEFGEEVNILHTHWIKHSERAFIDEQTVYIPEEEDPVVLTLKIRQAWDFAVADFVKIAKKFNLDIRLFGWERGVQFSREILIVDNNVIKDRTYKYSDWDWEVPFSDLGG